MTSDNNLVLEHLRHIRGKVDSMDTKLGEVISRVGHLEHQYATISTRLDRIDLEFQQVQKRLELVE